MSSVETSSNEEGEAALRGKTDHFEGSGFPGPSIDARVAFSVNGRTPVYRDAIVSYLYRHDKRACIHTFFPHLYTPTSP